jgi:secreted PhoX family phosphatase
VEEVTPGGKLFVVAGNGRKGPPTPGPATSSDLDQPSGVAVDSRGDLFIADPGNAAVEEVTRDGVLSVAAGVVGKAGAPTPGPATSSHLDGPDGVAVDSSGNLFIADWLNLVVEKVSPAGMLSIVAGNGQEGPAHLGLPSTRTLMAR